jgi:predicted signal transduction protein with EAL and GGDEF domain
MLCRTRALTSTRGGPESGALAEELLTQADAAMYAAKAAGKGCHAVYDERMPVRTWTELEAAG